MATNKNITMKQYNGLDYDTLYPKTTPEQVGAVSYEAQTLTDTQKAQARGNIGAAPDGFGLGGEATYLSADTDLNNITDNGWYQFGENPINSPTTGQDGWGGAYSPMFVNGRNAENLTQTIFCSNNVAYYGCQIKRVCASGTWYPWEWVNPPMRLGVEYRTTERYLGKPVYVKAVNFGALPNAATKTVIWATANEVSAVLSVEVTGNQGAPVGLGPSLSGTEITATTTTLYIKSSGDYSTNTAVFRIKYTKTAG